MNHPGVPDDVDVLDRTDRHEDQKVATTKQSPMRLVAKAFLPAVALASVNQNEMKYEHAHALPTEEGEQQVVAEHEHQHEGEQVQVEEELEKFSHRMYPIE